MRTEASKDLKSSYPLTSRKVPFVFQFVVVLKLNLFRLNYVEYFLNVLILYEEDFVRLDNPRRIKELIYQEKIIFHFFFSI